MNLISEWSSNSDDETCDTSLLVPHWKSELERRDPLHRYSKNLRTYNAYWTTHCRTDADDDDGVWLWLKNNPSFSLPACPREVLERQRVAYLSSSERESTESTSSTGSSCRTAHHLQRPMANGYLCCQRRNCSMQTSRYAVHFTTRVFWLANPVLRPVGLR